MLYLVIFCGTCLIESNKFVYGAFYVILPQLLRSPNVFAFSLLIQMYGPSAQYACEGIENQRLCWSAITPYYPAWGNQLAITGKV